MPDLVNDPRYEGIDLDRGDMNDPEYWSPERVEKRNLWREWAGKQRDAAANLTQRAAEEGIDANTALSKAGFADAKEHGKYIWTLFGNEGLFATQGNVDPNLEYDWGRGVKTWKEGTENAGKSIPITRDEYDSKAQAQNYQRQGLMGYGAHANAQAFNKAAGAGHFQKDPKSGMYFNVGQGDPNNPQTWEWKDQYGRSVNGVRSAGPTAGYNYSTGGGTGQKINYGGGGGQQQGQAGGGGYLPDQGGGYDFGPPMGQYGGGDQQSGGYAGGVPDMYAGTRAAVGMPQAGGNQPMYGGPNRQQRAGAAQEDQASPYQQLIPKGADEMQRRQAQTNAGFSGQMGGF